MVYLGIFGCIWVKSHASFYFKKANVGVYTGSFLNEHFIHLQLSPEVAVFDWFAVGIREHRFI
jgi:hypothetical protein